MAALPRPYWKGYLKLSLVSCPIAVYASTSSSERVAFKQVNRQTGNRLRQQLVDENTGEVVETSDKARGYEVAKHDYLLIEDEEIEAVAIETSHTINIDSFVPKDQVDQRFLDSPYYLVPNDKVGQDAFAVIRDAMRGKEMVAIGRVVMAKRERIIMLQPWGKGLIGTSLRYANEVRDAGTYFDDLPEISVPADMLALAEHILDSKRADFDPTLFTDRYEDALVSMIKAKQAGTLGTSAKPDFKDRKVVDLMAALKASLAAAPTPAERLKVKKPKSSAMDKKRAEGQRDMLLPISGTKVAKEAAKATPPPATKLKNVVRKAG